MSVSEVDRRTQRYLVALENVKRDPARGTPVGTLEMWENLLNGRVTFEDWQAALDDALNLRQIADEQLESLDYHQQSDN